MQASWVKQGTSTTGTGTITLDGSAPTGYQAFSNAFATGDAIPYTIIDGNNRESGYGTLTSGANWTLSRDVVYETLVSGTYAKYPSASAITLSGSAIVTINASAMSVIAPTTKYQIGAGGSTDCGDSWGPLTGIAGTTFPVADRLEFESFTFVRPRLISKIGARVTVANGSAQVKAGIYTASYDGLPDKLLATVTIDASSTGAKLNFLSPYLLLPAGVYFTGVASDDATTVQLLGNSAVDAAGGSELGRDFSQTTPGKITCYEDLGASWTDLPTTATVTSSETQTVVRPYVFMG